MLQNNDIQIRITLTDEAGTPFVISALNALELYAYRLDSKNEKIEVATYKKSNAGVYGITTINDATGIVEIVLNREKTRNLPAGIVYLEPRIQIAASSEFISSLQNLGAIGIAIDTNYTSANPNSLQ